MLNDRRFRKKIVAPAIFLVGAAIFFVAIDRGFYHVPNGEVKESLNNTFDTTFSSGLEERGHPTRIIIPKIDLDAEVEEVGITFKGNMSTPKNIGNTGWYKYGTVPGELGSSVIDGHVDNGFNLPGVFANLKNLNIGDDVYVKTSENENLHFVVVDKKIYPYKEVPLEEVFNKNDAPRLNLITCEGDWIDAEQTDENRLVVYTRLVE